MQPLNPQIIGQTESALGALLGPVLAEAGRSFEQWVVLAVTADGALAAESGRVQLTAAGQDVRRRIRARIDEVTSGLFDFPAEDLATAGRVLATVTERANAFLAGHVAD